MVKVKIKVVLLSQLARSMTKHSIDCELNSRIFCRFLRLESFLYLIKWLHLTFAVSTKIPHEYKGDKFPNST